ncbi:hypothetical protein G9A89_014663 [Geosiphon pyriformis]|nr:hypothetical protein G9A89_014663 [Geosiphon pyriformis]
MSYSTSTFAVLMQNTDVLGRDGELVYHKYIIHHVFTNLFKIYRRCTDTLEHENLQLRSKVQELQGTTKSISTLSNWLVVMFPSYFPDSKAPVNIDGKPSTIPQDILLSENEQIKNDLGNLNIKLADLELTESL